MSEGFECPVCSIWNPPSKDGIGAHLRCDCDYDWDADGNLVVDLEEPNPDTPMGIYTPTSYHQTGGTDSQQNKEE